MSAKESDEEKFRRLAVELRILEGTVETLQSRINYINAAEAELRVAEMTIEGLEKEGANKKILVPIGAGSYVRAKLDNVEKVIAGIGAQVAVERTLKEAKENVKKRLQETQKTSNTLRQQLTEVLTRIQDNRATLQELSRRLSQRERSGPVREAKRGP